MFSPSFRSLNLRFLNEDSNHSHTCAIRMWSFQNPLRIPRKKSSLHTPHKAKKTCTARRKWSKKRTTLNCAARSVGLYILGHVCVNVCLVPVQSSATKPSCTAGKITCLATMKTSFCGSYPQFSHGGSHDTPPSPRGHRIHSSTAVNSVLEKD